MSRGTGDRAGRWRPVRACGLACRGGAGCGSARRVVSLICEPRGSQDLGSSQRPLSEIEPAGPGSQAKARTFVCARVPGPVRRLDTPDV